MRHNGANDFRGRRSIEACQMQRCVPSPILLCKGSGILNGKRTNDFHTGAAFGGASEVDGGGPRLFGFGFGVGRTVAEEEDDIGGGCSVLAGDVEGCVAGACGFSEGHGVEIVEFVDYVLRCAEGESCEEGVDFFCLCFVVVVVVGLQY
mmetsp:Transcript_19379/g.25767  ORF Transcript_19379/g.25767 Transcript_19379/m.25767 type:complete len:149 (-) Transcript_19379:162-608(-)